MTNNGSCLKNHGGPGISLYLENKKDFIKWKIRSLEHEIALYICALTHPVREGDWDQLTSRIAKLEKTGYI